VYIIVIVSRRTGLAAG